MKNKQLEYQTTDPPPKPPDQGCEGGWTDLNGDCHPGPKPEQTT